MAGSSSNTTTLVCFPCRRVHSRGVYYKAAFNEDADRTNKCPKCNDWMHDIGDKLQVPKSDDDKAWAQFYNQATAPGYWTCRSIDPKRHEENMHWGFCKLWKTVNGRPVPDACERCVEIAKRVPENERRRSEQIRIWMNSQPQFR